MNNILIYCAAALLLAGCGSSSITSRWKLSPEPVASLNRVMVVGIMKDNSNALRAQMERHIAEDLCMLGYDAVSSYDLYGPKSFSGLDEQGILKKLNEDSIDAVLTIVLLSKEKERYYVPGYMYYSPYAVYYDRYYPYYVAVYNRIYEEGYYVTDTNYFWESNLYILHRPMLLYSVQTRSFDPATTAGMAHQYGRLIVQDMVSQGVLQDKSEACCP